MEDAALPRTDVLGCRRRATTAGLLPADATRVRTQREPLRPVRMDMNQVVHRARAAGDDADTGAGRRRQLSQTSADRDRSCSGPT